MMVKLCSAITNCFYYYPVVLICYIKNLASDRNWTRSECKGLASYSNTSFYVANCDCSLWRRHAKL